MKLLSIHYLRGIAALLVVVAHNSFLLSGEWVKNIPGALGVDIFFIISGFIITLATQKSSITPVSFIIKRFFRIWPVFFITWLLACLFVYRDQPLGTMINALLFGLQDYTRPGPGFGNSMLGPPWTLTYELLFYLLFGLSMMISYRYRSYVCAGIILASTVGLQLAVNGDFALASQISPQITVTHWWQAILKVAGNTILYEFIFGMLLAEAYLHRIVSKEVQWPRVISVIALIAAPFAAFIIGPQKFGMYGGFWLAALILLAAIISDYYRPTKEIPLMMFFGDISYSLYLVHFSLRIFILRFLPENTTAGQNILIFIFLMLCSILLATLFFHFIEKPGIKLGHRIAEKMRFEEQRVNS
ncbi:acyltransferase [Pantoea sp.]|uniref:acyltransferase family protein n=1 Tax=Pantoea sp. TaxID=69393 RepID=UPI0031DCC388